MNDATVTLRRADDATISTVESLLADEDLPFQDVRAKPECFYVGYDGGDPGTVDGGERVGIGGLEIYGTDGLLRSVVVDRSVRGRGFGAAIVAALEREAREEGVETLYLLTTTAADFFEGRGYAEIERADAPEAIRGTAEFEDLCPASATCMTKPL